MPERRGSRFVVEALFLAALTVALALAHLEAIEIVGAMAAGWLVVAVFEWASWRGEPHYGSGLPPRYVLPRVELPPPKPLEQVDQGYPESGRDDAPTWIASASLRAEVLGEWPLFGPVQHEPAEDEEEEPQFVAPAPDADPWTVAALPAAPVEQHAPAVRVTMRSDGRLARYSLDPLGEAPRRRRLGRGSAGSETIEVPARPRQRALPSTVASG